MKIATLILSAVMALALVPGARAQSAVTLTATDGVKIFGTDYPSDGPAKATILLFHQAGASRVEYVEIAPRLAKAGYRAIAIDQRSGGAGFGGHNQTVAALGASTGFETALADLEATLAYAKTTAPEKPVIVWGSSYSAALVFLLAAKHPHDLAAVMAFSPGEYLDASVAGASQKVVVPVFVTSASDQNEIAAAKAILDASPAAIKVQLVPKSGVHGSSTLRSSSNPGGAAENWSAVLAFLARIAP